MFSNIQNKQNLIFHRDFHEDYYHEDNLSTTRRDDSDESRDGIFDHSRDDSVRGADESFFHRSLSFTFSDSSVEVFIAGTLPIQQFTPNMTFEDDVNFSGLVVPKIVYSQSSMQSVKACSEEHTIFGKKFIFNENELAEKVKHLCRSTKSYYSYLSEGQTRTENGKRGLGLSKAVGQLRRHNQNKEAEIRSNKNLVQILQHVSRLTKFHLSCLNDSPTNYTRRYKAHRKNTNDQHLTLRSYSLTPGRNERGTFTSSTQVLDRPTKLDHCYASQISEIRDEPEEYNSICSSAFSCSSLSSDSDTYSSSDNYIDNHRDSSIISYGINQAYTI